MTCKAQSAPIYWIFFMVLAFGVYLTFIFFSPLIETMSSMSRNLTASLPLNGSVAKSSDIAVHSFVLVPIILVVGLLIAMIVVAQKKEFDTGYGGEYG